MVRASELSINESASALQMADTIFGDGVAVVGASYTGDSRSSGIYTNADSIMPGVAPSDTGVILSTGQAEKITNSWGEANRSSNTTSSSRGPNGMDEFDDLAGNRTFDASFLDVDIIPDSDVLTMNFVFLSEEYPEYVGSAFNDMVGVWSNGSVVPVTVGDTSVDNINMTSHYNLFVDNTQDAFNTEMDGFTITLKLIIPVIPGEVNSIRIGIADVGDSAFDSNLMISSGSIQTELIANDDMLDLVINGSKTLDVLANDSNSTGGTLTITHINGVAVVAGDTVTLATGQQITLNADGTFQVAADGDEEEILFTYEVASSAGETDIGFVTLNTIPCFVAGTMIMTPDGERPVESLTPGTLVMTHDDGAQPVRWLGRRTVAATGQFAPIRIAAGTFGAHRDLLVSPQHRILLQDERADLLFGETEVLVAAKDLVNDLTVRPAEGGEVDYVHVLFDRHQVIWSQGMLTESFLPGPHVLGQFEQEALDEICALFPELNPATGDGYSPAARRMLRTYEAQALVGTVRAA